MLLATDQGDSCKPAWQHVSPPLAGYDGQSAGSGITELNGHKQSCKLLSESVRSSDQTAAMRQGSMMLMMLKTWGGCA